MEIIAELNHRAAATHQQLIDRVCDGLSDDAAALMLELAGGMIAAGWDKDGNVERARRRLARRLGGGNA